MLTDVTQKRRAGKQIQYQVSRMHDTKEDILLQTEKKKLNIVIILLASMRLAFKQCRLLSIKTNKQEKISLIWI